MTETPRAIYEQNRAAVQRVVESSGLRRLPKARVEIEAVEAVEGEAAVDLQLALEARPLRLRFANRDDAAPAFERTPSWNVVYLCDKGDRELDSTHAASLLWVLRRLARFDPGGLAFAMPERFRPKRLPLPVVRDELVDRVWRREVFDRSIARVLAAGTRVQRVQVVVTQACEMSCVFCPTTDRVNIHFHPSGEEGQYGDLVHQLEQGRALGATEVDFGGNDVLRFPRVLELFAAAGRLGYTEIIAQSPGQILADRAFAAAAAAGPLTQVCLPIYGTTAVVHDAITRRPGTFEGLCQALDNLRALGRPRAELHTIALGSTLAGLEGLIQFSRERFDRPLRVCTLHPNRQGERTIVLDMASFSALAPLLEAYPESFRVEFPPCVFPRDAMAKHLARRSRASRGPRQAPINLFDLGLPDGCEDALVTLERTPIYPPRCEGCEAQFACGGVQGHYLEQFGDGELRPFVGLQG